MIRSYGPPDSGTPGNVGDLYIDAKTEEMYRCVKVIPDVVNQKISLLQIMFMDPTHNISGRKNRMLSL